MIKAKFHNTIGSQIFPTRLGKIFAGVENILRIAENVSYSLAFLLFPRRFSKAFLFQDCFTVDRYFVTSLTHSHTVTPFDAPGKQAF